MANLSNVQVFFTSILQHNGPLWKKKVCPQLVQKVMSVGFDKKNQSILFLYFARIIGRHLM